MADLHNQTIAQRAAAEAARNAYGRLLAYLARSWRDISAVEDALGDAFARALQTWPDHGVPANPDAWLLVAARNRLIDVSRTTRVRKDALEALLLIMPTGDDEQATIPDKRLELMFVCAHPAIPAAMHAPLMLQTVLGLSAESIASSFLVSPDTMSRRLTRAKQRILQAGIGFSVPEADALAPRVSGILEAIYAAYGHGWDSIASDDASRRGLGNEAIWLARVLDAVLPGNAEVLGLLSLMLFCDARFAARRVEGAYVPFAEQETGRWASDMISMAEASLGEAARLGNPGRFQLEAAIQSAMVQSRLTGADLRVPLLALHTALVGFAPTVGNLVGRAAALADVAGAQAGIAALDELPADRVASYQPYWALRAHLLGLAHGAGPSVQLAYAQAAGLSADAAVKAYLAAAEPR